MDNAYIYADRGLQHPDWELQIWQPAETSGEKLLIQVT